MALLLTELLTKSEIRAYCKTRRAELSNKERAELDASLCEHLADALGSFDTVLCFYPSKGEPNILPVIKELIHVGKRIYLPLTHKEPPSLEFFEVSDLELDLETGAFGIPAPKQDLTKLANIENAVCVVPALAFDKRGYRVGYGKGFYDRFLYDKAIPTVGVCYSEFLTNMLPNDKNDVSVDIIITEKGVIRSRALKTE